MPLDVLGRTRATLTGPTSSFLDRKAWVILLNPVVLLALITSLPFVHTARRYYRLNGSVRLSDWPRKSGNTHLGPESCPNLVI